MADFNIKMVMILLGLSFLSCSTSKQLSDQDSLIKHGISYCCGSNGGESIRSRPETEWFPSYLAGSRRFLGRKYAETIKVKDLPSEEAEKTMSAEENSHTHHHHHHYKKRPSTKPAVSSTFVNRQKNEGNSVAAKEMNAFSWRKTHEKYDQPAIFHVDYSGPKTHPPKNN